MKRVEIDLHEFISMNASDRKPFIESKLKDAGFDMDKFILSSIDSINMKYIYMQLDINDVTQSQEANN